MNVHPKVKLPAAVLAGVGAVIVALGYVLGDKVVTDAGLAVLGSSGVGGVVGYFTPEA